jgi:hypothetical protein
MRRGVWAAVAAACATGCPPADGPAVLQDARPAATDELRIEVDAPRPQRVIRSPLRIRGRARGPWYFEGDFPIRLLDAHGREIATAVATAQGPWMTEDWVPFEATLTFEPPSSKRGTLVLEKDNPSGRTELDAEHRVPVLFRTPK